MNKDNVSEARRMMGPPGCKISIITTLGMMAMLKELRKFEQVIQVKNADFWYGCWRNSWKKGLDNFCRECIIQTFTVMINGKSICLLIVPLYKEIARY